jgi:hypothetical protein
MKFKPLLIVSVIALTLGFAIGCATAPANATPEQIAAVQAANQQKLNDSAVILRNLARTSATLAISDDQSNAKHVKLAVVTLETFLTGASYEPGALTTAMQPVLKEIKDPKINLAVNSILDLYQIFYGRIAKDKISQNEIARTLLTAIHDGAVDSLPK